MRVAQRILTAAVDRIEDTSHRLLRAYSGRPELVTEALSSAQEGGKIEGGWEERARSVSRNVLPSHLVCDYFTGIDPLTGSDPP